MATSGSFETSSASGIGGGTPNRIKVSWSLASQSVGGNYSDINWNARGWGGNSGYWVYKYSSRIYIEGDSVHNTSSQMQMYQNSIFASGTKRVYHASNGALTLNISCYGAVYYASENVSGSGSWSLPTIPREASITSAPNFTDEDNPTIGYSNPAGSSVTSLKACIADGSTVVVPYRNISETGSSYKFNLTEAERDLLRAETPTSKTKSLRFYVQTVIGGNTYTDYLSRTLTIVNGEPTFSTFTHKDVNASTVAITGDDQYYIQGQSELEITVLADDKAIAQKLATMSKYNVAVGSLSVDIPYVTTDVIENVGTLGVNTNSVLAVKAVDSRGFITTASETINVLPYVVPQIELRADRTNNFEAETTINIEATISRLTVGGVDKNAVNATTGVKYRYKETSASTWGSWVDVGSTTSTDRVTATPVVLTLDNTKSFNVEVQVIDKLNTSTASIVVERGVPVFFIDQEGRVAVNGVPADYSADPDEDALNPTKLDVFGAIRSNGARVATYPIDPAEIEQRVLWSGVYYMNDSQTAPLSENVTDQLNGIILVWSRYASGTAYDDSWNYTVVPKWHVQNYNGSGVTCVLGAGSSSTAVRKYVYVGNTAVSGNAVNDDAPNSQQVLRKIIGF